MEMNDSLTLKKSNRQRAKGHRFYHPKIQTVLKIWENLLTEMTSSTLKLHREI